MAAWVKEEENASDQRQKKRETEEADKVEVAPAVTTVASLRRFRAALIGPTQRDSLSDVDCAVRVNRNPGSTECGRSYAFGCMVAIRGGGIRWLAAGIIPNSLYRVPFFYLFLAGVLLLLLSFCRFCFVSLCFFCSRWSFVDVSVIFFIPAGHVPDWQPRILLGMVEARSVN